MRSSIRFKDFIIINNIAARFIVLTDQHDASTSEPDTNTDTDTDTELEHQPSESISPTPGQSNNNTYSPAYFSQHPTKSI
ncbi:hypothetical protein RJT34_13557 [Clitoria ternatea]|uniref:Uncharacterized protein n=1 Tax=Clitoria ternatea TaxID=43366 RepID=A0AAN9JSA5_CLITE